MAKAIEFARILWGQAYLIIENTTAGRPGELWWIKPTQIQPIPHPTDYLAGFAYQSADGSVKRIFPVEDVIWIPDPNVIEQYAPLSPLAAARLAGHADLAFCGLGDDGIEGNGQAEHVREAVAFHECHERPPSADVRATLPPGAQRVNGYGPRAVLWLLRAPSLLVG